MHIAPAWASSCKPLICSLSRQWAHFLLISLMRRGVICVTPWPASINTLYYYPGFAAPAALPTFSSRVGLSQNDSWLFWNIFCEHFFSSAKFSEVFTLCVFALWLFPNSIQDWAVLLSQCSWHRDWVTCCFLYNLLFIHGRTFMAWLRARECARTLRLWYSSKICSDDYFSATAANCRSATAPAAAAAAAAAAATAAVAAAAADGPVKAAAAAAMSALASFECPSRPASVVVSWSTPSEPPWETRLELRWASSSTSASERSFLNPQM